MKSDELEIGRFQQFKSEIPKSRIAETGATSLFGLSSLRFRDFGFKLLDWCDFEFVRFHNFSPDAG
jgi:hypothetical protein